MNIDEMLHASGNAKPRRGLKVDFTKKTVAHIRANPRKPWWRSPKELLMKVLDKPAMAIAGLVVTIAVSGTAYAAVVNWPNITAMFGGEQQTNGGRIVQVDTKNCGTRVSAFNITKPANERDTSTRYFKVKNGSKLTNDQITQMVFGNCEQDAQADALKDVMKNSIIYKPENLNKTVGGYIDNVVTAISPTSITLEADYPYGETLKHLKAVFTHIDPAVEVYYKTGKLAFSDLKVGDHVAYSYRATGDALTHSETTAPSDVDYSQQTLLMVVKNTPNITAAIDYQKHLGSDFEEVVKCDKTPTGFCNVEEYLSK